MLITLVRCNIPPEEEEKKSSCLVHTRGIVLCEDEKAVYLKPDVLGKRDGTFDSPKAPRATAHHA
jgi:hypothetical protein